MSLICPSFKCWVWMGVVDVVFSYSFSISLNPCFIDSLSLLFTFTNILYLVFLSTSEMITSPFFFFPCTVFPSQCPNSCLCSIYCGLWLILVPYICLFFIPILFLAFLFTFSAKSIFFGSIINMGEIKYKKVYQKYSAK